MPIKKDSQQIEKLIGKKICQLRKGQGLSQEVLAEMSGINPSFLGCIERGQKCPTLRVLEKIRSALNVSYPEMFDFSASRVAGDESRLKERFFRLLKELNKRDLALLDGLLDAFLQREAE